MTNPDAPIEVTMPPGSVIITPAQIYAEVRTMGVQLERLTTVIDPALNTIREDISGVDKRIDDEVASSEKIHVDHETRLRSIEKRIWVGVGVASTSGAGLATLIRVLST